MIFGHTLGENFGKNVHKIYVIKARTSKVKCQIIYKQFQEYQKRKNFDKKTS